MAAIPEDLTGVGRGRVKKGSLRQVVPRGPQLRFQWNPLTVKRTPSVGRWNEEERPHQKPAVEWAGQTNERLVFSLRLDGFPAVSIEPRIAILEGFGKKRSPDKPPPELEFDYGPGERGTRWVIETIEPGDELRNARLQIVRQEFVVALLEYTEANVVVTHTKDWNDKKRDGDGRGGNEAFRLYTVRDGDTLASIAAAAFADPLRWIELAELNGIRDPNRLEPGRKLQLPDA